jgi:hypothetical protein
MMGLAEIIRLNNKACEKAKKAKLLPYVIKDGDREKFPPFPFPNFGDYRPKGWELVGEYFVDSSGFGMDDEPALSIDQFLKKLKVGHGYALIEEGEFQVYVGEFVKNGWKQTRN